MSQTIDGVLIPMQIGATLEAQGLVSRRIAFDGTERRTTLGNRQVWSLEAGYFSEYREAQWTAILESLGDSWALSTADLWSQKGMPIATGTSSITSGTRGNQLVVATTSTWELFDTNLEASFSGWRLNGSTWEHWFTAGSDAWKNGTPVSFPAWLDISETTLQLSSGTYSDLRYWPVLFDITLSTQLNTHFQSNRLLPIGQVRCAGPIQGTFCPRIQDTQTNNAGRRLQVTLEEAGPW